MEGVHGSRRYVWYRTRLIELLGKALVPPQYMFIIRTSVDTPRDTSIDVNMSHVTCKNRVHVTVIP